MERKSKYTKVNGEGGNKKLNPTKSAKTLGFKPLIATSLALALGVSMAVADPTLSYGDTPSINVTWQNTDGNPLSWISNNNGLLNLHNNTTDTNMTWFEINLDPKNATTNNDNVMLGGTNWTTWRSGNNTVVNFSNTTNQGLELTNGAIKINFANAEGYDRNVNLSFNIGSVSGTDTGTLTQQNGSYGTALKGDLVIYGGENNSANGRIVVNAKFGGDLEGNLKIQTGSDVGSRTSTANVTFIQGSILGNVENIGKLNLTLNNGNITGDISTQPLSMNKGSEAKTILIFNKANARIGGNILTTGGTSTITFSNNPSVNTIQGYILANGGTNSITANDLVLSGDSIIAGGNNPEAGNGGDSGAQGKNLIEISGEATLRNGLIIRASNRNNQTTNKYNILKFGGAISGNSATIAEMNAIQGNTQNVLSFDNLTSTTTLTIADLNKQESIGTNITGNNYIGKTLTTGTASNGNLALVADLANNWSSDTYQATNLSLNVTNNIYTKRGNNYINVGTLVGGGLKAMNGGQNLVKANTLTINGDIFSDDNTANTNRNVVIANTFIFNGNNISAGAGTQGYLSQNQIEITGNTTFSNAITIKADNTYNTNQNKFNILKLGGSVSGSISKLTAITNNNNWGRTKNILSFENSETQSFTIGVINDSVDIGDKSTGYNYIGKSLTQDSGSSLALNTNFTDNTWSDGVYTANLNLSVTGTIYSKNKGFNYINVASLNANAITSEGATNKIATSGDFTSQNLSSMAGGVMQIIIGGDASINTIDAGNGNGNGNNTLTFNKDNGSHSIAGNITANTNSGTGNTLNFNGNNATFSMTENASTISIGGDGNNTLNIQGDTKVTSNLVASRTGGNGKNIFNISNAKSLTLADARDSSTAKTLTTNSGATEINFVGDSNGSTGNFSGNVSTTDGTTTFAFTQDGGTYGIVGDLSTSGAGQNIIDLSSKSATISNDLNFTGSGEIANGAGNIINIGADQALTLSSGTQRTLASIITNGGKTSVNFDGDNASLSGNISTATNDANTNLVFNHSGSIAGTVSTTGGITTITLANLTQTPAEGAEGRARNANGVSAVIQGAITTTSGTTTIKFASGDSAKTLTLGGNNNTITDFTFDTSGNSTNNTIVLSQGTTTLSGSSLSVGSNNAIAFNIENNTNLTLTNGLTTNGGETTFNFNGDIGTLTLGSSKSISTTSGTTTFNLGSSTSVSQNTGSATITIDGQIGNTDGTQDGSGQYNGGENFFSVNAKNVTLKSGDSGLAFDAGLNVIEFANTSGATLSWKDKDGNAQAIQTTGGSTTIRFSNSGTIEGAVSTTGGNTTFEIDNNAYAVVTGNVTTGAVSSGGSQSPSVGGMTPRARTASTDVNFTGNGALVLRGASNNISNVTLGDGTHILSLTDGINDGGATKRNNRRTLVIDNITTGSGSLILGTQTTTSQADTFIIKSASGDKQGTYHFGIIAEDGIKLDEIGTGESGAVRLASVADGTGISFESRSKVISDFTTADADITHATTDENGNKDGNGYTSYYIGKVSDAEVIAAEQEITATAFTLNYDLYMANLNSLNKRMGELRDNAHSQGVWARVFNGALTNSFGLESKSNYTTIQAGYDYAFGFEGANNYLGVALSYALSTSTSQNAFDSEGQKRGIDNVYSNAVEVALYNSYVSDSGWYNDTIAKFSYIMSKFDISNLNTGSVTNNDTTNFALTLGDEVGYVFKLGENKEWSITPQIEATFGYFNQSDFKQTLANSTAYLASSADAVLTLRTRVGSAFAYDFKNFTQKDTFNASLYVGTFYEYDYVSGGGITLSTDQINGVENILSDLNSDGRVVMNVGTNMSIKDNTRLYFDFEKSFGGKITTDYQVNFGVRYSFGESNGYTPIIEKTEFKAPLKVEGEEEKKEGDSETKEEQRSEKAQESKEVEKTTEKTQDKSTKDKIEEKKAQ